MTFFTKESKRGSDYSDDIRYGRIAFVIIFVGLLITGLILTGLSFKKIDTNKFGLQRNIFTSEVSSTVETSGLHLVGFWNEFIIFPSTWLTVSFTPHPKANDIPISVQTANGLLVSVDTSFQFKLRQSDLYQLFLDYGTGYMSYIEAVARSALRAVVGSYNAESLYANRTAVNNAMNIALYNALNSMVQIGDFQLRSIDFPQTFEDAVEAYEVWRVEVQIAQLEQEAEVIRQKTLTLVEEYTANRTIIEYEGIAQALATLQQELNMTNEELTNYLWIQTIREHDQSYLFIGLQDIPILIPVNGTL